MLIFLDVAPHLENVPPAATANKDYKDKHALYVSANEGERHLEMRSNTKN